MYRQTVLKLHNIKHSRIRPKGSEVVTWRGYRTNGKSFWNRRSVGTQIHKKHTTL